MSEQKAEMNEQETKTYRVQGLTCSRLFKNVRRERETPGWCFRCEK